MPDETIEELDASEIFTKKALIKLDDLISNLPLDEKELYNLYFIERKVSREIGLLLGCSHSRVAKSVKELKTYLIHEIKTILDGEL